MTTNNKTARISVQRGATRDTLRLNAMSSAIVLALAAIPFAALAGPGFGDTTNLGYRPNGKMPTFYANSPSGLYPAGACYDANGNAATPVAGGLCDSGPGLRKFVDTLPGLTSAGANNLGNYVPVAVPVPGAYADADYYEIAVVEYRQKMHSDLPAETTLRGYVQIDAAATDAMAGLSNGAIAVPGSRAVPLVNVDGSPVLIARPSAATPGGFLQVQAYAVDRPSYLGPAIVASRGRPVRLKFYNALPIGRASNGQRLGDLFLPVDETLPGGGFGPDGKVKFTQNRAAVHLHGGDTPWISDGTPHQWIAPAGEGTAANGVAAEAAAKKVDAAPYLRGVSAANVPDMADPGPGAMTYYFPNNQSARLMWYHDHTLGLTRLNAYAGMAAAYVLTDAQEAALTGAGGALAGVPDIPLVIQDKTFVPANVALQDARWDRTLWGRPGDLWFPHVIETNQDPMSADGTNPVGRWDWGPFFWPVFPSAMDLPTGEHRIYAPGTRNTFTKFVTNSVLPGPSDLGLSEVTTTPEAFADTPLVNGVAYPSLTVEPRAYRFRLLNGANDRMWNLGLYVAADAATVNPNDPAGNYQSVQLCDGTQAPGANCSEVRMVPFVGPNAPTSTTYACDPATNQTASTATYPISFPCGGGLLGTGWGAQDNRPGGVPDPRTAGPSLWLIGTEGGFVPKPVEIPSTPLNYEYNKRSVTVLNTLEHGVYLGGAERADVVVDFSKYAGKTLILYNDAPAPAPAADPRLDYYTGVGDQTAAGGAPNTVPGYGPNTRTVMQIKVAAAPSGTTPAAFDFAALGTQITAAYVASQPKPIAPQAAYAPAYPSMTTDTFGSIFTGSVYLNKYNAISFTTTTDLTYTPAPSCSTPAICQPLVDAQKAAGPVTVPSGTAVNAFVENKAIQELFDPTWGRMNATLGVELPFTSALTQTTIPLAYIDPATETVADGETQFWKITHNGVDVHPVHFHLVNVQILNRVGWDGTIKPPMPEEIGWKETVKMNPLEDIIIAVRAKKPETPFGLPHSYRPLDPTQPLSTAAAPVTAGFTQVNPKTGTPAVVTNVMADFQNEYVWHCHILGHEENDFMRPFVFNARELPPPAFSADAGVLAGGSVQVTWNDPTPVSGQPGVTATPPTTPGNKGGEIGFRVERALVGPTGTVGAYAALGTTKAYTSVLPPAAAGGAPVVFKPTVNTLANAVSFVDASINASPASTTAPSAPASVTATAVNSQTASVSWTPGTGTASGFLVFRDGVQIGAVAATARTFVDNASTPGTHTYGVAAYNGGTSYSYRVAAVSAVGETYSQPVLVPVGMASSAPLTASVTLLQLYPATALTANLVSAIGAAASLTGGVDLAFYDNSSADASGYRIEACVGTCTATSPVAVPNAGLASVTVTNGGAGYTTAPAVTFRAAPAGGTTATGTAVIGSSGVTGVTVTNAGTGYTSVPTVTFSAAPAGGTTATGTAAIGSSSVTAITVTNGGTGYTSVPAVTFSAAPAGGTTASGTAVMATSGVTSATVSTAGSGYTTAPTVTFSAAPAGGTTATGTATISGGRVTGITVTSAGSGYLVAPTITLSAPATGTRATAKAAIAATAGKVTGITLTNAGAGYYAAPTITIATPATGTRATATAAVAASAGKLTGITVTNIGAGYVAAPSVTIGRPATGTTATASAAVGASNGKVIAVTITNAGTGYTAAPSVTIAKPATGTTATATSALATLTLPGRTNFAVGAAGGPLAGTWYPVAPAAVQLAAASAGVGASHAILGPLTLASNSTTASTYAFRVTPMNGGQAGTVSNISTGMNLRGTVAAPSGVSATAGLAAGQARVAWTDAANNNASYVIQQRTASLVDIASVTSTGSGYVTAPTVVFSAPPAGGQAPVATAVLGTGAMAGKVVGINVTTTGVGYTTAPTITLSSPPVGGTQATAIAVFSPAGAWSGATVVAPGSDGNAAGALLTGLATGTAYQFQVGAQPAPGGAAASAFVQAPAGSGFVVAP